MTTGPEHLVELFVLPDEDFFDPTPLWGIDGRPARVGLRVAHRADAVLLSMSAARDGAWLDAARDRLSRGEFGGIPESEALRLRMDRAAAARLTHARFSIAAHRYHPTLGVFVGAHRPYTHYRGVLLDDPYCVLCGLGDDRSIPLYPCSMLRTAVDSHPLVVPGGR